MSDNPANGPIQIRQRPFGAGVPSRLSTWKVQNQKALDYYGESQLAEGIGQDFFDFVAAEPNTVSAVIGHVSGGSVAAVRSLISGLRARLRASLSVDPDIRRTVRDLNRTIWETSDSIYATLFCATLDAERHELRCVNAGHETALLVRRGGARVCHLETTGAVLGLTARAGYGLRTISLESGDLLAVLTDGIVESVNAEGRTFGVDGVVKVLRGHSATRSSRLVAALMGAVRQFASPENPVEDRTAMVVRFSGAVANLTLEDEAEDSVFAAA